MKKSVGIATSIAAMALAGTGLYMMMSKDTKRHMTRAMNSAKEDACRAVNKVTNSK